MSGLRHILIGTLACSLTVSCMQTDFPSGCDQDESRCTDSDASFDSSSGDTATDAPEEVIDAATDTTEEVGDVADSADTSMPDEGVDVEDSALPDTLDTGVDATDAAVCAAGSHTCIGDALRKCKVDGSGYDAILTCPSGTCSASLGRCTFCSPGARDCSGSQPTKCDTVGSAFVPDGAACVAPQTCSGGGTTGVCGCTPITTCPAGKSCGSYPNGCGATISCGTCSAGTCDAPSNTCRVCTPSAVSCASKDLHTCNSTGTVDTVRTCPVDCVSGACLEVTSVAAGYGATCALISDGTVRCWGDANAIGDGTTVNKSVPTKVFGLAGATQIATSGTHSCARLGDGSLRCWGANAEGQLGDATNSPRQFPVLVTDSVGNPFLNVASVSTGRYHTCAVTTAGTVYCWGENAKGQLGDGTLDPKTYPVAVAGLTSVDQVVAGYNHSCAHRTDGTIRCWGNNAQGQIGSGSASSSPALSPTSPGLTGIVELLGASLHTCARSASSILCWGYNASGQIGNGMTTNAPAPLSVSGITTSAGGSIGRDHVCASFATGTVKCWGKNEFGQLGDGTITDRSTPVVPPALTNVKQIYSGGTHSCALFNDGVLKCWGSNLVGQLGDGTNIDRLTPVTVKF